MNPLADGATPLSRRIAIALLVLLASCGGDSDCRTCVVESPPPPVCRIDGQVFTCNQAVQCATYRASDPECKAR